MFNWTGITFPVSLEDINKFEKNNNVSIHVFGWEGEVYPLRISKHVGERQIDLLLLTEGDKKHYCWIKNFNKFMAIKGNHNAMHYCRRCLNCFTSEQALSNHDEYCSKHDAQKIEMPKPGSILKFKNYFKSMRVPFIIYADFESFIKTIDTCMNDPSESYTKQYQKHIPSSFCYYVKSIDDKICPPSVVRFTAKNNHDDIAQKFMESVRRIAKQIYEFYKDPAKPKFTKKNLAEYRNATTCHICGKGDFDKEKKQAKSKVLDHCHITGIIRGAAHSQCNLRYRVPKFIPIVFHNLSGYDSHLFIKKLKGNISCIPCTEEKYISFSETIVFDTYTNKKEIECEIKLELRFIDSFRFMPTSLDALVKNLDKTKCKNVARFYKDKQLDLLLRKGVYPYEYINSVEQFDEPKLPSKEKFHSKLNNENISDEDYEHAQNVWREFDCKTLRDYHELYNKSDVLLLADVFENFRDVCMENYKLDPAWYFTSPGLAWDAALKLTKVELELLSDYDMLLMIKHGIRGGISTISNRYAKANNKYMGDKFNINEPSKFITYLDANQLYPCAMSKPLPTHGFQWMPEEELSDWKELSSKDGVGCILEVDLDYPSELHDLHNDYPLAPETLKINGVDKLIPNLNNKTKYILHYENLKQYESLDLKITKIHRGIKFEESPWLKSYIDLNTELRKKAANGFEKDFFKLMNNSVFGKTMENIENRIDFRLVINKEKAIKLAAKPNYDRTTIFDENLIGVHMRKTKLVYNKPIYLGMAILRFK